MRGKSHVCFAVQIQATGPGECCVLERGEHPALSAGTLERLLDQENVISWLAAVICVDVVAVRFK
jgi:hypothetical protein